MICGTEKAKHQRQIDRIRSMTVKELAEILAEMFDCNAHNCPAQKFIKEGIGCIDCENAWARFLESEVDTE